ncbi:MAG TPA: GntR family transcriptional regulator [Methylomirabilota bacterium]|jgi:GntR family transcriptional regulator|nr:GntR family transcriptional regulator [Methylomirabilota bacterium]
MTTIPRGLRIDGHSPIPIRRQLTEQLKHVIEAGGVPRDQPLPSIRELAGFLGINPNTVARAIEDLKQSGHVEVRRGTGVFVAPAPPARPSVLLREAFLKETAIRAAALGMTPDEVAVGVLSVARVRLADVGEVIEVLLVECSPAELDFFARELEAQLPVRPDKVLLGDLAATIRRRARTSRWAAAVTSFEHLPDVERLLDGRDVPVIALLAEAQLETLHRLAQLPSGTRVGVVSTESETAHTLAHSIANAALPNLARVDVSPAEGAALGRLARRVDVIVCSTSAVERVRKVVGPAKPMIVDDRALNQRAIQMLGAVLAQHEGDRPGTQSAPTRRRPDARGVSPSGDRGRSGAGAPRAHAMKGAT